MADTTDTYTAERTLSAVFKEQSQVDQAIRRLIALAQAVATMFRSKKLRPSC